MRKITDFIADHCYAIFAVILVFTAVCGFLATKVHINKNIYSYMPVDSETSMALDIMNDEFDYDKTSSYEMMLTDVPESEKMNVKKFIESVDGVSSVEYSVGDNYNRDEYTRYIINIDAPADSDIANNAYNTIHDHFVKEYQLAETGQVHDYNGAVLKIPVVLGAIACAVLILLAMSKSWIEPFLFLFVILLAVVMNKGTNIIFPSVSHITDSISAILQMALSMDYAIMLSTRYRQERAKKDCSNKQTAMRRALRYSFGAISSSSVTTVVGLIVLIFMSFTIGRDMGLVLSKGVILSLLSIFTTLPALLLIFDKAITKTEKKTLKFKMDWLANYAYNFRKFAVPAFLFIFAASFILKGSTLIKFTAADNNKIKDIFDETNQIALVYDEKMDGKVTELCKNLDKQEETTRVLCYGNTINEPEKYHQVVAKVNSLSDEKIDTKNYLIKALYYHYYRDVDAHTITLNNFVNFLQDDVFTNADLADDITSETKAEINRLSNFTDHEKVNRARSKEDVASVLGVDADKLDDVYVLYIADSGITTKLTPYQFASFVENEVLTDSKYTSMVTAEQRSDLNKLLTFSNPNVTDKQMTAAELASLLGISENLVSQLLVYYDYTTVDVPIATATPKQLIEFALNDETVLAELHLPGEQVSAIKSQVENAESVIASGEADALARYEELNAVLDSRIAEMPEETQVVVKPQLENIRTALAAKVAEAKNALNHQYSYENIATAASKVDGALEQTTTWLGDLESNYPELFAELDEATKAEVLGYASQIQTSINNVRTQVKLGDDLAKLKDLYKLYEAKTTVVNASPRELVNFLIEHANDERLQGGLNADMLAQLKLAQYVMNNQNTAYSVDALAKAFGLDTEKIRLVYALYEYRHININPELSLWAIINFVNDHVLSNPEYASRLGESEQAKLRAIYSLMHSAANGTPFNHKALYNALLPLSNDLDKNMLYLAYLYHGSIYDYDDTWTLTLEKLINFLSDNVIKDPRFSARIDDETKQKILDGRKTIDDAKKQLIGPKFYRALIETNLPPEGDQTFGFIKSIKDELGPKNKIDYFLVGDSAMAYEMAQTFNGEMNFITVLTMLSIFAVVIWTFKSFFVSMLLVLVIQCAVYIVMSYLSLTGSSIYFIALIIVQSILMGATIDYAILFTSYYVENRNYFKLSIKDALINTYNKSISAILTSASILVIVTALVGNFATAIAGKICQSISLGTFCATVIILVLLPPLLAILDRFIIKDKSKKTKSSSKILNALKSII